jgi:GT2 family glycosyltransferase
VADIWVVDNASTDGSAGLVREQYPWVNLIDPGQNLGFGPAVNSVAARTSTTWIAPANADVRLEPGALRQLLATGDRHPKAAVVAPRLVLPDGSTQHSTYPFPTLALTLAYSSGALHVSAHLARYWQIGQGVDFDRPHDVAWAVGAFLLVRRSAWDEVGGFDEAQWMYAEDLDLGWRLNEAGWKVRYEPAARVLHNESGATRQAWGETRYRRWHASTYAWLVRRRGLALARAIAITNVAGFLGRAVLHTVGALAGRGSSRQAQRKAWRAMRAHSVGLRSRAFLERVR